MKSPCAMGESSFENGKADVLNDIQSSFVWHPKDYHSLVGVTSNNEKSLTELQINQTGNWFRRAKQAKYFAKNIRMLSWSLKTDLNL